MQGTCQENVSEVAPWFDASSTMPRIASTVQAGELSGGVYVLGLDVGSDGTEAVSTVLDLLVRSRRLFCPRGQ